MRSRPIRRLFTVTDQSRAATSSYAATAVSAAVLAILATGCMSTSQLSTDADISYSAAASADTPDMTASELRTRLVAETARWRGTPYEYGGESRSGVDCSAFVQALYRGALGLSLPRATTGQRRAGSRVQRSRLEIGDLVFFQTAPKQKHVGVYLGSGEFAHASTSAGVTISSLDESYWDDHYEEAIRPRGKRLSPEEPVLIAARPPDRTLDPPSTSSDGDYRRGW